MPSEEERIPDRDSGVAIWISEVGLFEGTGENCGCFVAPLPHHHPFDPSRCAHHLTDVPPKAPHLLPPSHVGTFEFTELGFIPSSFIWRSVKSTRCYGLNQGAWNGTSGGLEDALVHLPSDS